MIPQPLMSEERRVLIVDDDRDFCESLCDLLALRDYGVVFALNASDAERMIRQLPCDVVLIDQRLGSESNGVDLIPVLQSNQPGIVTIMVTAYASINTAIGALKEGAYDYLRKPLHPDDLFATLSRAFEKIALQREKEAAEAELAQRNRQLTGTNAELKAEIAKRRQLEQELRSLNAELDQRVQHRTIELRNANKELEAFTYSVAHDLRAPLRTIDSFSKILLTDYAEQLDDSGRHFLDRTRIAAIHMANIISDLHKLSRISLQHIHGETVDLSSLAKDVVEALVATGTATPEVTIHENLRTHGDRGLIRVALENLFSNARKYTSGNDTARIELGCQKQAGQRTFFVRDNGVGFDMRYAAKLFEPFERLHSDAEFEGTGIGLAIVDRIVQKHGGKVWAEGEIDAGAVFYFTLPEAP
ncbi:MAG: response regulator [Gammaproteobacteria bacterium]|nr:response regulator [Gammaproteobacteria bacterium]